MNSLLVSRSRKNKRGCKGLQTVMVFVLATVLTGLLSSVIIAAAAETMESPSSMAGVLVMMDGYLTYRLYENAAIHGNATEIGVTTTTKLSLDSPKMKDDVDGSSSACYLSGELEGSVTFHQDGWYTFNCSFHNTSTGWVWIDGHVVCGDNHPYQPSIWDNPLKIQTIRKHTFPLRAHIMTNATTHCYKNDRQSSRLLEIPTLEVIWNREPLVFSTSSSSDGEVQKSSMGILRQQLQLPPDTPTPSLPRDGTQVQKQNNLDLHQPIVPTDVTFHPQLPLPEQRREELQRRLKQGWGYWLRSNILSIVKLPEGLIVSFQFCIPKRNMSSSHSNNTEHCLELAVPDLKDVVRVDLHAYDRSYSSYNISFDGKSIQMECSVTGSQQQELQYLISVSERQQQPKQQQTNRHDYDVWTLKVVPRYAWFRPGDYRRISSGVSFTTPGLGVVNFTIVEDTEEIRATSTSPRHARWLRHPVITSDDVILTIQLSEEMMSPKLGFIAGFNDPARMPKSIQELQVHMRTQRRLEETRVRTKFQGKALVAEAIQAAVMWTLIYNPIENGPFMPVSRSSSWDFGGNVKTANSDWTYVIFDWDNFFASLLAGLDNRDIAYSNLFQVVKSKTAAGFVPNWSTGGLKSQDRTEPPVGAKVLLELFKKYQDEWIVEALLDDLLDWNDWFMNERLISPAGVIALGSYYDFSHSRDGAKFPENSNTMWAARMESGLDNSPMYDGELLYDERYHLMNISDVGMTSLVCQEAYSLATLADAVGRDPMIGQRLRERGDNLVRSILSHFWDDRNDRQIFSNRYQLRTNHTFVSHITPTSFYPFLFVNTTVWREQFHHPPRPEVMETVISSWLLNSSRFCIRSDVTTSDVFPKTDPNNACYWGLPSVSADDPTFMSGSWNYWRGLVWGPMSQLVYWSLQGGSSSNVVTLARASLCNQMKNLMLSQWTTNRHICENYSPYKNATDCSGTNFYHWGALNGLIGMIEEGYW
ncbi:hypothetical protein IV203_020036 [Nitzschia inconspicua]|uniref:Mannosylglycerate hydrolase MGH1-like glycoside hydrolase domain-containing protein n=1 Tax=Nitzschia inconspicua TaxID=303405 RepID=A0A9K3M1Z6_9STRA|nr:hypothetical protein IV203_020036 [Nitzschia inconspicua]